MKVTTPVSEKELSNPTMAHIHSMRDSTLLVNDAIESSRYIGEDRPIFVFNFKAKSDKILLNGVYTVT